MGQALHPTTMDVTFMQSINKVFATHVMLWIGVWIHHRTDIITFPGLGLDFQKSVKILGHGRA